MNYGQFDLALKFLELLNDFPKAINLLFLATNKEEFEKAKAQFILRGCLNFADSNLMSNLFFGKTKTAKPTNYSKIFDNYRGEPFVFGANFDKLNLNSIKDVERKVNKKNSFITNIHNKKLSFGETAFQQYVNVYNHDTKSFEVSNICHLVIQKFDQFYGYKNTFYEKAQNQPKKVDFMDYNIPLSEMKNDASAQNGDSEIDNSIDPEAEEFQENQYLSAYFHFEKPNGTVVPDVTDNNAEGTITVTNLNNNMEGGENKINDDSIWSSILEEFEPIEYEDKWGRKAGGAYAIKFSKSLNTCFRIKHNPAFSHFSRKFTVEFWIKIFTSDVDILKKDVLKISLQSNFFIVTVNNKIIPPTKLKDYSISPEVWTHISVQYRKKDGKIKFFVNCEEVVYFSTNALDDLGKKGELVFGNENLEGELTEVRIWNQFIPIKFLTNNHKAPLPILAENKRKLKMKINKQDEKKAFGDKNVGFRNQSFLNTKFAKPRESGFVNQSSVFNRGVGKSTILNPNVVNSLAQSHEISSGFSKKENPVTINSNKVIPEGDFKMEDEPKYPGFTFESPDKGRNDFEAMRAPSFVSVIQQNDTKLDQTNSNVNPNFDPNDFKF